MAGCRRISVSVNRGNIKILNAFKLKFHGTGEKRVNKEQVQYIGCSCLHIFAHVYPPHSNAQRCSLPFNSLKINEHPHLSLPHLKHFFKFSLSPHAAEPPPPPPPQSGLVFNTSLQNFRVPNFCSQSRETP
jgi:hypothetical protein